jgi:hypothetical protein
VISAGIDNTVKIWDMRKAALETTIKGHTDTVTGTIPIVRYLRLDITPFEQDLFLRFTVAAWLIKHLASVVIDDS